MVNLIETLRCISDQKYNKYRIDKRTQSKENSEPALQIIFHRDLVCPKTYTTLHFRFVPHKPGYGSRGLCGAPPAGRSATRLVRAAVARFHSPLSVYCIALILLEAKKSPLQDEGFFAFKERLNKPFSYKYDRKSNQVIPLRCLSAGLCAALQTSLLLALIH